MGEEAGWVAGAGTGGGRGRGLGVPANSGGSWRSWAGWLAGPEEGKGIMAKGASDCKGACGLGPANAEEGKGAGPGAGKRGTEASACASCRAGPRPGEGLGPREGERGVRNPSEGGCAGWLKEVIGLDPRGDWSVLGGWVAGPRKGAERAAKGAEAGETRGWVKPMEGAGTGALELCWSNAGCLAGPRIGFDARGAKNGERASGGIEIVLGDGAGAGIGEPRFSAGLAREGGIGRTLGGNAGCDAGLAWYSGAGMGGPRLFRAGTIATLESRSGVRPELGPGPAPGAGTGDDTRGVGRGVAGEGAEFGVGGNAVGGCWGGADRRLERLGLEGESGNGVEGEGLSATRG